MCEHKFMRILWSIIYVNVRDGGYCCCAVPVPYTMGLYRTFSSEHVIPPPRREWVPYLGLENIWLSEWWSHPPESVVNLVDDDPIANGTLCFSTMPPSLTLKITSRRGVRWLCDLPSATLICLLNVGVSISPPVPTVSGEDKASLGTLIGLCWCAVVPVIASAMKTHAPAREVLKALGKYEIRERCRSVNGCLYVYVVWRAWDTWRGAVASRRWGLRHDWRDER